MSNSPKRRLVRGLILAAAGWLLGYVVVKIDLSRGYTFDTMTPEQIWHAIPAWEKLLVVIAYPILISGLVFIVIGLFQLLSGLRKPAGVGRSGS